MDTDKPLLYELRECTLKDYSLCEYVDCIETLELATIIMCIRHDNRTTYLVKFYSDEHSKHISLLQCL